MVPTPLAESIAGRVQQALQLLITTVAEGDVFDPAASDKVFRLSMNDLSEAMILPNLLSQLQLLAPNIGVKCYQVPRRNIEAELAAGTLDFVLDAPLISGHQICKQQLLKQRYVCVVRKGHPVVSSNFTLEQYLSLDHILVSSRREGLGYEDVALNRLGRQRRVKMRVQHYQISPLLVAGTDMALTIPMSMAQKYDLEVLELPFSLSPLDVNLYWHKSADHDHANQWRRELLISLID